MDDLMANLELIATLLSDWLLLNALQCWSVAAVFFMLLEILIAPLIGFLFFSLGSIFVAALLNFDIIDSSNYLLQFISFSVSSLITGIILPLISFSKRKKDMEQSFSMSYNRVEIICDTITKNSPGYVKWSGTRMKAYLSTSSVRDAIYKGDEAYIDDVKNNVLTLLTKDDIIPIRSDN